jgi:MFS transporter, DHA1 family, inner membrane transport protein
MTEMQAPDLSVPRWWIPVVALGTGAGCISALQPILLNLLLGAGKLGVSEMGAAATAEAAGMAVATTLAAFFLPLRRLRLVAFIALTAMLLANAGTVLASGAAIVALRLLSGSGAGILLWILVGMFTRSPAPARLFAIYVTAQSILGLVLSQAMTEAIVPLLGYSGGYIVLSVMNLLLLLAVWLMPDSMGGRDTGILGLPPLLPCLAIVAISCHLAGILAVWVYILPLLKELGYPAGATALAVPVTIAGQIAGGIAATILASRLSPLKAWIFGLVVIAAGIFALTLSTSPAMMLTAVAVIGFLWIFVPPFHMPVLLSLDASGRGAMLIGTAQLSGTSLGPLAAAAMVSDQSVAAVIGVGLAFLAASLVLLAIASRSRAVPAPA